MRESEVKAATGRVPYSEPAEPDEWETTMTGRKSCEECGEWMYPHRPVGSDGPFAFLPYCRVCGAPVRDD